MLSWSLLHLSRRSRAEFVVQFVSSEIFFFDCAGVSVFHNSEVHEHESHVHRAASASPGHKQQENHQGMFPVADAALQSWIKGKKCLKCCISVSHKPEGHLHETRGHKTSPSQHGEEEHKGIQAAASQMRIAKQQIKPLLWQNNANFFVFPVAHNLHKHVHEAHGHRISSGHVKEETNVESKGTAASIVMAPFAEKSTGITVTSLHWCASQAFRGRPTPQSWA